MPNNSNSISDANVQGYIQPIDNSDGSKEKHAMSIQQDAINAPPTYQQAHTKNCNLNTSNFIDSTLGGIATISIKLNPLKAKLSKRFGQMKQYAQVKLSKADDLVILPEEYRELEKKADNLQRLYQNFYKVSKTYKAPHYDYPIQIQDSLIDLTNTVASQLQQLKSNNTLTPVKKSSHPKSLHHAMGSAAAIGVEDIGKESAFGAALDKLSVASNQVGDARLYMDQEIVQKFNSSIHSIITTEFEYVNRAKRTVQQKKFALIMAKKNTKESPQNVEKAERELTNVIEEATIIMKTLLEDVKPLRELVDYARAQYEYFKQAQDIYSQLVPELERIKETQESLNQDLYT